jgi:hypothetical protein
MGNIFPLFFLGLGGGKKVLIEQKNVSQANHKKSSK